jgi:hypothetical protein
MAKPKGERGSWFAQWDGESVPCVHRRWTEGVWPHHCDPCVDDNPKWVPFIEALKLGRAILTEDNLDPSRIPVTRKAYVAIYRIENVEVSGGELHFDFRERLADFR